MSAGTGFPYILYDLLKVSMSSFETRERLGHLRLLLVSRRRRPR